MFDAHDHIKANVDGETKIVDVNGIVHVLSFYQDELDNIIKHLKEHGNNHSLTDLNDLLLMAECQLLHSDAKPPYKKRPTDVGYDIFSYENCVVPAHGSSKVNTGIALSVHRGFYYTIEGRSGMGCNDSIVPFRGIIDSNYTGEIVVKLFNFSDKDYVIEKGQRIAQLIISNQLEAVVKIVQEFSSMYNIRGTAGFGSSGK